MRILILIQDKNLPSSRIRMCNLVPELEKAGLVCDVQVYPKSLREKHKLFGELNRYEAVVLQKKIPSLLEAITIAKLSRKLIFDFDDAIYIKHDASGTVHSGSRKIKTGTILKLSDMVVAGNRILKTYADSYCPQVRIIPSCVEVRDIPVRRHGQQNGPVIIGWVGGKVNLGHLQLLGLVLKNVAKKHEIELRILCDASIHIPGVTVRQVPWTLETQEIEISQFDIGVMPLPLSKHAEGKCGYKAIQCMAARVPVVVSDVGVNRDIVRHGHEGFVVPNMEDFEHYLEQLIVSPLLREEMGARARKKVEEQYSVELGGKLLAQALLT